MFTTTRTNYHDTMTALMIICPNCGKDGWKLADCCTRITWKGMYFYSRVRHETAKGKRSTCYIFKELRSRLKHLDMLEKSSSGNILGESQSHCRKSMLMDIPKRYRKAMDTSHRLCNNHVLIICPTNMTEFPHKLHL